MSRFVPAEWAPHRAMWLGYPSHAELWQADLEPAREDVAALARALAGPGAERVRLLACDEAAASDARLRLRGQEQVEIVTAAFGDIWLRDTGPIFLNQTPGGSARPVAVGFRFNGWGGKYVLAGDDTVGQAIANEAGAELERRAVVIEGGALEHDGLGTVITTAQCLLNPNRNPGWTQADAEAELRQALGARAVLWLGEGLLNDHTDGHVDNLARFVAPGVVACPSPSGEDDPNADAYEDAASRLAQMRDATGRMLEVARIPSPGALFDEEGQAIPASHMNFLIANRAVILPTYEDRFAPLAQAALTKLFPDRQVIALPANAILTGGGSFHCISQQEPA